MQSTDPVHSVLREAAYSFTNEVQKDNHIFERENYAAHCGLEKIEHVSSSLTQMLQCYEISC